MTIADPKCPRCSLLMVWIGVGGGALPQCPKNCDPIPPGSRCPGCSSLEIEPYDGASFMVMIPDYHCRSCGKVFWKKDAL